MYEMGNVCRMMSHTPENILKIKDEMEAFARMKVTGFIHNSNLQDLASADDLRMGYPVLREASLRSGIPVVYTTARKEFLDSFLQTPDLEDRFVGTPLPLETFMHRSWTNFADGGI